MPEHRHNNLKRELEVAGRTQKWLYKQLEMSEGQMSRLCNCHVGTTKAKWKKIAELLDTTVDKLTEKDS